jgi:8-oxo-dGTP pyrophosphatase MutT (NUDIX family)
MRQPISFLVYPVRRGKKEWEYLLLRRVVDSKLGFEDFWQGVTGDLEENENLTQAARRELAEETGFVSCSLEQIEYTYSFPKHDLWNEIYPPGVVKIVEHVFIAIIDRSTEPTLSPEHDTWEWCSLDRALGKLKYPGNIEALCSATFDNRLAFRIPLVQP